MVRLIPDGRGGWREDAPATCLAGHAELVPNWEPCPGCGDMVRTWPCRAEGCGAELLVDDEHVHGSGRRRAR
jgi:hypothetical protein